MHKYCLVFKGDNYYYPQNEEALSGAFRTITKTENDEFLKYSGKSLPSQKYLLRVCQIFCVNPFLVVETFGRFVGSKHLAGR